MPGIRSIADIKARCWVDDITGCWHWRMATDANGSPSLWLPALNTSTSMGVAIGFLLTGKRPGKGTAWHCTCETPNCANPAHRKEGTRSTQMLAAALTREPAMRARVALSKRRTSRLSDDDCMAIRRSEEPLRVLAERYGISFSHASLIRRGEVRRELGVRGSSVFNLGANP